MARTQQPTYLDLQARIGITKHTGGYPATERLLELCRVREGSEVLYVGSGIGVGPAHLARTRRCRVVAIDISEQMLEDPPPGRVDRLAVAAARLGTGPEARRQRPHRTQGAAGTDQLPRIAGERDGVRAVGGPHP